MQLEWVYGLDQVYFSNLKKFDGKKLRRLNLSEIGQIAGDR